MLLNGLQDMESLDVTKKRLEWMGCDDRTSDLYRNGVKEFLDFAFVDLPTSSDVEEDENKVPCPYKRCNNSWHKTRKEIDDDLLLNGIVKGYVRWIYHGEYKPPTKWARNDSREDIDDIFGMIYEARELGNSTNLMDDGLNDCAKHNEEAKNFDNLMRDT